MLNIYLDFLELDYFEVKEAFRGLKDEHVWKRPAPGLISVGELAGHIAYWEAVRFAGDGAEPADGEDPVSEHSSPRLPKSVKSHLVDHRFSYLPRTLKLSPSDEHLAMSAAEVCTELLRVHSEAVAVLKVKNPDLDSVPPGWPAPWTYREFLKYMAFHVAYHTGQIYSARHLLGEETPDN